MMKKLKDLLRKSPFLVTAKRRVFAQFDYSLIDVVSTFPAFKPNSAGRYRARAKMTIEAINQTTPMLAELSSYLNTRQLSPIKIDEFPKNEAESKAANELGELFSASGSDKARHGYHLLYGPVLQRRESITKIFEIGLGTNNTEIVSTMGLTAVPGASLRAFRDFCPNANVYGADIDRGILFSDERIRTFYVDQLKPSTFATIADQVGGGFDLVIDDGLHSPNANIASLIFGLKIVRPGGWVVIEDVALEARDIWDTVAALLHTKRFRAYIFHANTTLVFAVHADPTESIS